MGDRRAVRRNDRQAIANEARAYRALVNRAVSCSMLKLFAFGAILAITRQSVQAVESKSRGPLE